MPCAVAFKKRRITITRKKVLCTKGVSYPGTLFSELIGRAFIPALCLAFGKERSSEHFLWRVSPFITSLSPFIFLHYYGTNKIYSSQHPIRSTGNLAVSTSFGQ